MSLGETATGCAPGDAGRLRRPEPAAASAAHRQCADPYHADAVIGFDEGRRPHAKTNRCPWNGRRFERASPFAHETLDPESPVSANGWHIKAARSVPIFIHVLRGRTRGKFDYLTRWNLTATKMQWSSIAPNCTASRRLDCLARLRSTGCAASGTSS